jgi:hypothetical protein
MEDAHFDVSNMGAGLEEQWELMRGHYGIPHESIHDHRSLVSRRGDIEDTLDRYFGMRRHDMKMGRHTTHYDRILPNELSVARGHLERRVKEEREDVERDERYQEQSKSELMRAFPREAQELLAGRKPGEALAIAKFRMKKQEEKKKQDEIDFLKEQERLRELEAEKTTLEFEAMFERSREIQRMKDEQRVKALALTLKDQSHIYQLVEPQPIEVPINEGPAEEPKGPVVIAQPTMGTGRSKHIIGSQRRRFTDEEVQAIRSEYWTASGNKKGVKRERNKASIPHSIRDIADRFGVVTSVIFNIIERSYYYYLPLAEGEPEENLQKPTAAEIKLKKDAAKRGITLEIGSGGRLALPMDIVAKKKIETSKKMSEVKKKGFQKMREEEPEKYKEVQQNRLAGKKKNKKQESAEAGASERSNAAAGGGY